MSSFQGNSSQYGRFYQAGINLEALKRTSPFSSATQYHLAKVYASLAGCSGLAALGVHTHLTSYWLQGGYLSGIICFIALILILGLPNTPEHVLKRSALLVALAFCQGLSLGPLIESILDFYPRVLTTAIISTAVIFASFALSALCSRRRSWFFLGSILASALGILSWSSLLNLWLGSAALFRIELYIGLAIFCIYVIYDTQLIIEKSEQGYRDVVGDCVSLFTDLIAIFIRILILLADQEDKKQRKRERQTRYYHREAHRHYY